MKNRVVMIPIFIFLMFGILLHSPLVFADGNDSNSSKASTNVNINSDDNESDDNDDLNETEDNSNDGDEREISGIGLIQFVDIEGGCWKILSKNGQSYEPVNLASDYKQNGLRVKFKAELSNDTVSVCQVGTLIKLKEIEKITNQMNETRDERRRAEIKSREIIRNGDCIIKIEREVKVENGKSIEVIKRTRICQDGTREDFKMRIENRTEDGRIRERIKYEFEGREQEIEAGEGIKLEEDTNGTDYKLRARFRGDVTDIKVMPDRASAIAIERLKALNFTIELKEVATKGNVTKLVYHAKAYKDGKLIGIFKLKVKIETQIDPETGEVITTTKPWWAFFVTGEESNQTGVETGNQTNSS